MQSLQTFLSVCGERGIEPYRKFSGRFVVRVPVSIHERATEAAAAAGVSLNQWVQQTLAQHLR
jgi:predicted HicB family RNase H-like nuclease